MSLFKKTGKQYAVEKQGSLASSLQAEQPAQENASNATVEVGYRISARPPSMILSDINS